jgi:GGDEF domain-containing protein
VGRLRDRFRRWRPLGRCTHRRAESLPTVDALTGVASHRALEDAIERDHHPLALLVGGLDGFKDYCDTRGIPDSDDALRRIFAALADEVPPGALLARVGGDEFGVLHVATRDGAVELGERAARTRGGDAAQRPRWHDFRHGKHRRRDRRFPMARPSALPHDPGLSCARRHQGDWTRSCDLKALAPAT